jgi:hypothetical protein
MLNLRPTSKTPVPALVGSVSFATGTSTPIHVSYPDHPVWLGHGTGTAVVQGENLVLKGYYYLENYKLPLESLGATKALDTLILRLTPNDELPNNGIRIQCRSEYHADQLLAAINQAKKNITPQI